MRVSLLDGTNERKEFDGFERIQEVANKIRDTEPIRRILHAGGKIKYKGVTNDVRRTINLNNKAAIGDVVPTLLQDMKLCNWQGKVYSNNNGVYAEDFAKCFGCLLEWLCKIGEGNDQQAVVTLNVTVLQMEDALEWLVSAIENLDLSESDQGCVHEMIEKFEKALKLK
jgi:hypothetical protein